MPKKTTTSNNQQIPKWVMPYNEVIGIYDSRAKKVMLIEDYGPQNGIFIEGWRAYHFPRTSPLVEKSYREGGKSIFIINQGKTKLNLIPSFAPIGISKCQVKNNQIYITYEGYGGGGVSAAYSRGLSKGVIKSKTIQSGGGKKLGSGQIVLPIWKMLLVGIDDTDNEKEGATYALAHNIATEIENQKSIRYLIHGNIQLYPYNPYKTSNCFSTVIGFLYRTAEDKDKIIKYFRSSLQQYTLSQETAMVIYDGFYVPRKIRDLASALKFHFFDDIKYIKKITQDNHLEIYPITGQRGIIGACAAIGLYDLPDFASGFPENYMSPRGI
ncbi:MAG TPA: hypothetical protein ENL06_02090 [Candidatus Portnoybacteria bacterium]|nr:hypothetical protein [Candidatus Portnoybacteria bacterium]